MKGKRALSYLTALSILFSQGISTISKASTTKQDDVSIESALDADYTPLPINTIFNANDNSRRIADYAELTLVSFVGDEIIIPSFAYNFDILDNDKKNDYDGSTVSISKIEADFDINEYFNKSNKIEVTFEHSTKEPIFFSDLKTKEIFISKTFFADLQENPRYSKIKKIRHIFDIEVTKKFQQDDGTVFNPTGKYMAYSEYIETIYKKYIPKAYWPVEFNFKGNEKNATIPQLTDEILNQSIYDSDVELVVDYELKSTAIDIKQVLLAKYNPKSYSLNDLFTNEELLGPSNAYKSARFSRKALDFVQNAPFLLDFYTSKESNKHNMLEIIQEMLWNSTTVGELVEGYRLLPMEYTIDYSTYDFTNHPNVVQVD